jgi:two-component system cell cycle response regulator
MCGRPSQGSGIGAGAGQRLLTSPSVTCVPGVSAFVRRRPRETTDKPRAGIVDSETVTRDRMKSVILVADDDRVTRAMVSSWLVGAGYDVIAAPDGEQALALALEHGPDLLLVDVTMPGRDGYDVCRAIQAQSGAPPPVIFLTAHSQTNARVAGLDAGAVDYIVKPFANEELVARVRAALRTKAVHDGLAETAARDGLTGLFNRRALDDRAVQSVALAQRHGRPFSCLLLDIDHFKRVNDTYGHAAGDEVLCEVARRICDSARITDVVGRYGGEEFVVLLSETLGDAAVIAADRIRARLSDSPIETGETSIPIRASIGVAAWHDTMRTPADLYAAADQALYRAKDLGRDRTELYNPHAARA